jgi:hypothetical protein
MSSRGVFLPRLKEQVANIIGHVNSLDILKYPITSDVIPSTSGQSGNRIILSINDGNEEVATSEFIIFPKNDGSDSNTSHISWVNTTLKGSQLGSFIFLIMIKILVSNGVRSISLENYADDPARAGRGIYNFMEWDTIDFSKKKQREFDAMSEEDKHIEVEGDMRVLLSSESESKLNNLLRSLQSKLTSQDKHEIWNNISNISKISSIAGGKGKRNNKKQKKTNKKKTNKKKTNKKKTNKKKTNKKKTNKKNK